MAILRAPNSYMPHLKNMNKLLVSYVGTAGHLYWLITGKKHPKVEECSKFKDGHHFIEYDENKEEYLCPCGKSEEQNHEKLQTQTSANKMDSLPNVPGPSLH